MNRLRNFALLLSLVLFLLPASAFAQERRRAGDGEQPREIGPGDEVTAQGILHHGPRDRHLRPGEDPGDEFHLIGGGLTSSREPTSAFFRTVDFSAVLDACHRLAGKAVVVEGTVAEGSRMVVSSIREKDGGITCTVEGYLIPPRDVGFDDSTPGWRLVTRGLSHFEFEPGAAAQPSPDGNRRPGNGIDDLCGKLLRVQMKLGVRYAFYEMGGNSGYEGRWHAVSVEELETPVIRGLLFCGNPNAAPDASTGDEAEPAVYLIGAPETEGRRLDFRLIADRIPALFGHFDKAHGRAVEVTGQVNAGSGYFEVYRITVLPGGALVAIGEGTLLAPDDDNARPWRLQDAGGNEFTLDGLDEVPDLAQKLESLTGQRIRVTARKSLVRRGNRDAGWHFELENVITNWEPVGDDDDE